MNRRNFLSLFTLGSYTLITFPKSTIALENNYPNNGEIAPSFELRGASINEPNISFWSLEKFKGSWLIIYFYPKDFTNGCTIEARGFNLIYNKLKRRNTKIIGISSDSIPQHKSFCKEEKIRFPLLSDPDGIVSSAYGSWSSYKTIRNTYLIDPKGIVRTQWHNANPSQHAADVLNTLKRYQNPQRV